MSGVVAGLDTQHQYGEAPQLFISYIKLYSLVSSLTIAKWLKEIFTAAGIDTAIFEGYFVRGASTTAGSKFRDTTDDILSAANWSSESSFHQSYYNPVRNTAFAMTVFSGTARNNTIYM